jgi:hypothetical protein
VKINKVLFVISLPILAQLLFSFTCCDCDDEIPFPELVEAPILDRMNLALLDNSGRVPMVSAKDTLSRKAFGIQFEGVFMQASLHHTSRFDSPFFASASALSCDCAIEGPINEKTLSIEIKSLLPFNNSAVEDSMVTEKFKILRYDRYYDVFENFNLSRYSSSAETFILTEVPDTAQNHQFEIILKVGDTTYLDTTKLIYLF